jgi:hypothetical protein
MKFKLIVEAVQLAWDNWNQICEFVPYPWFFSGVYLNDKTKKQLPYGVTSNTVGLLLNTFAGGEGGKRTGMLLAVQGDWIIKGAAKDGFYVCKPDIFAATYSRVDETEAGGSDALAAQNVELRRALEDARRTLDHDRTGVVAPWINRTIDAIDTILAAVPVETLERVVRRAQAELWESIARNCEEKSKWWEMTQKPCLARAYAAELRKEDE